MSIYQPHCPSASSKCPIANLTSLQGIYKNQVGSRGAGSRGGILLTDITGYSDAAVKLQRDWMQDPQSLHFAQHIKTHALVVLVQKGLRYHEIEQTLKQVGPFPCPGVEYI